jgi:alkanesulfonate monooxygenase SsuD/methylene tetrahydromethanopterin reductase-like flavin-dependent oxidoreductase (luciferase family)
MPRPVQKPHPEIVFGGHSKEAFSRAARLARGWYGFALDLDATRQCLDGLRAACAKVGRKFDDVEVSVTPRIRIDRDSARRFADLGVHRLILLPRAQDESGVLAVVRDAERNLIAKV